MPSYRYFLIEEVAEIARAPISTVRYWIATRRLRSIRPGRRRLVRERDLIEFLESADDSGSDRPRAPAKAEPHE